MSRRNRLLREFLENKELDLLKELLGGKKEEKKEEKKPRFSIFQLTLLGVLLFPFSGPMIAGLWKLSYLAMQRIIAVN